MSRRGHWCDCAIYSAPACEPGPCDCGGLDLAAYARYMAVTALIPTPGSLARFVEDGVLPSAIQTEKTPRLAGAALASAPDLIGPHDGRALLSRTDSVDLNDAGVSAVGDRKPFTRPQRVARNVPPHKDPPPTPTMAETIEGEVELPSERVTCRDAMLRCSRFGRRVKSIRWYVPVASARPEAVPSHAPDRPAGGRMG